MARFATLSADAALAASILSAPGWARVGINMPDPAMRERAASELARSIVEQFTSLPHDAGQLTLGL
jgi:hypothetical protein